MAELSTLARPYAKAAFEFADNSDALTQWSNELSLAAAVARTEKIVKLLSSPSLTSAQQAESFIAVCGDELSSNVKNFMQVLSTNKRLSLLPEISALYEAFKANREKSVEVDITSAFELDDAIQKTLSQALTAKLKRDVKVQTTVDKSLIGGVVIRAADVVIDSSIRGRLAKLAEVMKA